MGSPSIFVGVPGWLLKGVDEDGCPPVQGTGAAPEGSRGGALHPGPATALGGTAHSLSSWQNGEMTPTGPEQCWEGSRRHIRGGTSGEGRILLTATTATIRALPESRGPGAGHEGLGRRQVGSLYLPAHSAVFGGFLDRNGELDFSTFLTIMHMQIKQEDPKKEILLAMLMADKEKKGYIMASELRSKLMKLGEKLTHKEGNGLFPLSLQQERTGELGGGHQSPIHGPRMVRTLRFMHAPGGCD